MWYHMEECNVIAEVPIAGFFIKNSFIPYYLHVKKGSDSKM